MGHFDRNWIIMTEFYRNTLQELFFPKQRQDYNN